MYIKPLLLYLNDISNCHFLGMRSNLLYLLSSSASRLSVNCSDLLIMFENINTYINN